MHPSALQNCQGFFDAYAGAFIASPDIKVVEIGSQDVNGSLRETCPQAFSYTGVDFQAGKGVDIVLNDPYELPFESESFDVVLSSSCFEHSEMFWLVFLEVLRILKPHGLFYLNVPTTGKFHRHPVDCWRFYPDSGIALIKWARRNGLNPALMESYVQKGGMWQDYVAVFAKDHAKAHLHKTRILHTKTDFENGLVLGEKDYRNLNFPTQNEKKLEVIAQVLSDKISIA